MKYVLTTLAAGMLAASAHAADTVTRTDTTTTVTKPVYGGSNTETTTTTTWNTENKYWQETYPTRSYYSTTRNYTTYEPAYKYGVTLYDQYGNRTYTELDQEQLRKGWEQARGNSTLTWEEAQYATKDAYGRLYEQKTVRRTETAPAR